MTACQVVADELGIPLERARITATDTSNVPNARATAASSVDRAHYGANDASVPA